jgi:hypothetical protein
MPSFYLMEDKGTMESKREYNDSSEDLNER